MIIIITIATTKQQQRRNTKQINSYSAITKLYTSQLYRNQQSSDVFDFGAIEIIAFDYFRL